MPYKNIEQALANPVELQETAYQIGEVVEHKERGAGIIAAVITEDTEWYPEPGDDESEVKIEASEEEPAYVVGLIEGGSVPAEESDLESGPSELPGEGSDPDLDDADETEMRMSPVYEYTDNPDDYQEFQNAKRRYVEDRYSWELKQHRRKHSVSSFELSEYSYDELLNIPGVDDPEVGFASDPRGWTRKSYLQAWATVGATWRSCYARMLRHFGPRMAKRWCAALKDEVLGTERWRNRF
jgi:hypothetical protein